MNRYVSIFLVAALLLAPQGCATRKQTGAIIGGTTGAVIGGAAGVFCDDAGVCR